MKNTYKLVLATTLALFCGRVSAQDGFPEPSKSVVLWSARACYVEAQWSKADCTAILHVIRKRSILTGWPFLKMLIAYSAIRPGSSPTAREAFARRMNTTVSSMSKEWNEKWKELQEWVKLVIAPPRYIIDPCPGAIHWAAKYYKPKEKLVRVDCQLEVANAFYKK